MSRQAAQKVQADETWEDTSEADKSDLDRSPVVKALRLLSHLALSDDSVALADLSRALDLPKPTTFRLARSLEHGGFIEKDPLTRRYRVANAFEDIAWNALRYGAGRATRRLMMNELAERLGARVNLVVLKGGNLSFVEWVDSTAPLRIDIGSDSPMPIHCSASGKLLLAFGASELQEHALRAAPFKAYTKNTKTTAGGLERELAKIRGQGFAEDDQELIPGVNCLAVPIRNRGGDVVAGLAVMAAASIAPLKRLRAQLDNIRSCAAHISAELGWRTDAAAPDGTAAKNSQSGQAAAGRPKAGSAAAAARQRGVLSS